MMHPLLGKEFIAVGEFAGFYVSHSGLARGGARARWLRVSCFESGGFLTPDARPWTRDSYDPIDAESAHEIVKQRVD